MGGDGQFWALKIGEGGRYTSSEEVGMPNLEKQRSKEAITLGVVGLMFTFF